MVEIVVKTPTQASGTISITNFVWVCRLTPHHDVEYNPIMRVSSRYHATNANAALRSIDPGVNH